MSRHISIPPRSTVGTPAPTTVRNARPAPDNPVLKAVTDTLDLSASARNLSDTFYKLNEADKEAYLSNLARLLQAGIVGTETLTLRGNTYHSFASTRFADPEIAHATPARRD